MVRREGDLLNGGEHVLIRAVVANAEDEVWGSAGIGCLQQDTLYCPAL